MTRILYAGVVGLLGAACGSPETTSGNFEDLGEPYSAGPSAGRELPVVNSEVEVMHQFSAHGNEYEFLYAGPDAFMLSVVGPLSALPLPELPEGGPLTLLETYIGVAPEGDPPDPKLVDYHLEEARVLGRPDNSVLRATLNLEVPIEKALPSNLDQCKSFAARSLPTANPGWFTATNGTLFGGGISWGPDNKTMPVAAAACNYGGTASFSYWKYQKYQSAADWSYLGQGTLSPNSRGAVVWGATTDPKTVKVTAFGQSGPAGQVAAAFYTQ
jgi:hypothetical protein